MNPSDPETPPPTQSSEPVQTGEAQTKHQGGFVDFIKGLNPFVSKPEKTEDTTGSPKAGDAPLIPAGLEQAAVNERPSNEVVEAATVDNRAVTGSVDTSTPSQETSSVPAAINTATPSEMTDTVPAPTPVAMPPLGLEPPAPADNLSTSTQSVPAQAEVIKA